jgi:hypothetical protein
LSTFTPRETFLIIFSKLIYSSVKKKNKTFNAFQRIKLLPKRITSFLLKYNHIMKRMRQTDSQKQRHNENETQAQMCETDTEGEQTQRKIQTQRER